MIRAFLFLALSTTPVFAGQFDYLTSYANETQRQNNAAISKHFALNDAAQSVPIASHVLPVRVWRPSQDTIDGESNVVHNYLPGVWYLVSVRTPDRQLDLSNATEFVFERTKCNAHAVGCLKQKNPNAPGQQDLRYEPVYMGTDMPWGAVQ